MKLYTNDGREMMEAFLNSVMRTAAGQWSNATPTDFGTMALAIVLSAWFFTRFYGDR